MQMLTPARESCLSAIYRLGAAQRPVTVAAAARELGVAVPSASTMISRLVEDGLVFRLRSRSVVLAPAGQRVALGAIRRHRLVETYLVRALGLGWDEVHVEALRLEHSVSDRVVDALDAHLGHPLADPHGDPIPQPGVEHDETPGHCLADVPIGGTLIVERVADRDPAALREFARIGALPGKRLRVEDRAGAGTSTVIRVGSGRHVLDTPLAGYIHGRVVLATADARWSG